MQVILEHINSLVYRIASTIHFLLFFFISILAYRFSLPNRLIILIAVLNDAATLVIAADNALISRRPDKWRLGQLLTLSFILGLMLTIISLGHFWVAHYVFRVDTGGTYNPKLGQYEYPILQTIMYLNISSCPHFVIFSTRLATWFWKSVPSPLFTFAIIGTQIFAMFMSIFGIKELQATAM
jgi:H+-transporting ATPase